MYLKRLDSESITVFVDSHDTFLLLRKNKPKQAGCGKHDRVRGVHRLYVCIYVCIYVCAYIIYISTLNRLDKMYVCLSVCVCV